jgi:hypothetical protein
LRKTKNFTPSSLNATTKKEYKKTLNIVKRGNNEFPSNSKIIAGIVANAPRNNPNTINLNGSLSYLSLNQTYKTITATGANAKIINNSVPMIFFYKFVLIIIGQMYYILSFLKNQIITQLST